VLAHQQNSLTLLAANRVLEDWEAFSSTFLVSSTSEKVDPQMVFSLVPPLLRHASVKAPLVDGCRPFEIVFT